MSDQDVRHIPWAYRLDGAVRLPVTGDHHPLRREFSRWLAVASAVALLGGVAIFATWVWWSNRAEDTLPVARQVRVVHYTDLGVPPSIARPSAPQINVAQEVARIAAPPPAIAVPEPVADELATTQTIATITEMAEAIEPVSLGNIGIGDGTGDSLVVDIDIDLSPSPDEFIVVDEEPVRIRIDAPVYPDVARAAQIEGTVILRVLVGRDGKVKDTIVIDGPEPLRAAADRCARTSVWRPALIDNSPVEVWVMMPITFRLR